MVEKDKQGDDDALDFTDEPTSEDSKSGQWAYDPRPQEDTARRNIAYLLIGLLSTIVAAMLLLVFLDKLEPSDLKEFSIILGPIVALVSAATGFYYGTKNNNS